MSELPGRSRWIVGAVVVVCAVSAVGFWSLRKPTVTGDTAEERRASVIKLASDKPRGYVEALIEAGNDPDASVREAAAVCLRAAQGDGVHAAVLAAAEDEDAGVRRGACRTLMTYADQATVEKLTEIALGDPDEDVRDMAFTALAANKSPYATTTLMDLIDNGETPELRLTAAVTMLDRVNSSNVPNPDDPLAWQAMVAGLKRSSLVRDAYAAADTQLIRDHATEVRMDAWHLRTSTDPDAPDAPGRPPSRAE